MPVDRFSFEIQYPYIGVSIVPQPLAVKVERVPSITRNPTAKRRRRWCLRYEDKRTPCAYQIGNTIYMHPTLFDAFRAGQGKEVTP